jgi:hypothetical protein
MIACVCYAGIWVIGSILEQEQTVAEIEGRYCSLDINQK